MAGRVPYELTCFQYSKIAKVFGHGTVCSDTPNRQLETLHLKCYI